MSQPPPVPARPAPRSRAADRRGHLRAWMGLSAILLLASVLMLHRLYDSALHYPDADRMRMSGVFIFDFLAALPLSRAYDFALRYYAQYPAISIGYHPPLFAMAQAAFNAAFGVNTWSSRLALLPFAFLGISAWFALVRRVFDSGTAIWASLLLMTTPFLAQWSWYTMSDLPLLFLLMLLAYLFHRSTESPRPVYRYASALVFVLAVWTKQTAIFALVWFVLYLGLRRQLTSYLANRHFWISAVPALVALMPIALMTIWLGDFNLEQSIGPGATGGHLERLWWSNLTRYAWFLAYVQVTWPLLALSAVGAVLAIVRRDGRLLYFGLLAVSTYAFFTYVVATDPRYTLPIVPALGVFAALPLWYLRQAPVARRLFMVLLAGIATYQIVQLYAIEPTYARGYEEAARYVVAHRASNMVFFDGANNGNFTYFIRALDADRSIYVLRGDKLLSSSALEKAVRLQVHARSRGDIAALFDTYGVTDIVVEARESSSVDIHHELRRFLDSGPFRLLTTIPVDSNIPRLRDNALKVYRYLESKPPTAASVRLRVPLVGVTVDAPLGPATR